MRWRDDERLRFVVASHTRRRCEEGHPRDTGRNTAALWRVQHEAARGRYTGGTRRVSVGGCGSSSTATSLAMCGGELAVAASFVRI
jgi:hypothetical protein